MAAISPRHCAKPPSLRLRGRGIRGGGPVISLPHGRRPPPGLRRKRGRRRICGGGRFRPTPLPLAGGVGGGPLDQAGGGRSHALFLPSGTTPDCRAPVLVQKARARLVPAPRSSAARPQVPTPGLPRKRGRRRFEAAVSPSLSCRSRRPLPAYSPPACGRGWRRPFNRAGAGRSQALFLPSGTPQDCRARARPESPRAPRPAALVLCRTAAGPHPASPASGGGEESRRRPLPAYSPPACGRGRGRASQPGGCRKVTGALSSFGDTA